MKPDRRPPGGGPPGSPGRIALITLGCPKNQVDSEVLAGELARHGAELVADPGLADTVVINTCGFVADAKRESIDAVFEAVGRKAGGRGPRVVVWGCLAERYRGRIEKQIPEADAWFGVEPFEALGRYLLGNRYRFTGRAHCGRAASTARHTAYLKVSDGCDHRCAFCAIPLFKGRMRSRPPAGLVREAESLADRGVKELVLVAQDTTAYGADLGGGVSLAGLIRRLSRVPGIEWIRILYGHPAHVDDALIGLIADDPKVCKALDLPLQHISDPVLRAMGRRPGRAGTVRLVEKLRRRIPGLVLRTAFIVGFPGETKTRFGELLDFVREARFERMGAFLFSPEEGTRGAGLRPRVPRAEAEARFRALMRAQKAVSAAYHRSLESRVLPVLVDGFDRSQGLSYGRGPGDAPDVDATVWIRGRVPPGRIVPVRIEGSSAYDLAGRVVRSPKAR
jgi:ribosomal protein S12 methylthiotransferase